MLLKLKSIQYRIKASLREQLLNNNKRIKKKVPIPKILTNLANIAMYGSVPAYNLHYTEFKS